MASAAELQSIADGKRVRKGALALTLFAEIDPNPRKTWAVDKMLGDGELSCVFGAPGSGKSALVGDLAAHIARGKPWLGRPVSHGAVLYVAAERAGLVKRRLAAWRTYYDIEEIPLGVLSGTIDLRSSRTSVEEIAGHAADLRDMTGVPVRLIVIDTVSRALAGGDENSPRDMGALVGNLAALQEAIGAGVCVVHHVPQDGAHRMRGHDALIGAVDVAIGVEKGATSRIARVEKANDGDEGESVAFTLESVEIADGTTAPVVVQAEADTTARKPSRKLSDRQRNALEAIYEVILAEGKPAPAGIGIDVKVVPVDSWRTEMQRRGVIPSDDKNPRATFQRIREQLKARGAIAERDGLIWKATA
jgi:RecA-family ATPase